MKVPSRLKWRKGSFNFFYFYIFFFIFFFCRFSFLFYSVYTFTFFSFKLSLVLILFFSLFSSRLSVHTLSLVHALLLSPSLALCVSLSFFLSRAQIYQISSKIRCFLFIDLNCIAFLLLSNKEFSCKEEIIAATQ